MPTTEMIQKHLTFLEIEENGLIGYTIKDHANGDRWKEILVVFNGSQESKELDLPEGSWTVALEDFVINEDGIRKVSERLEINASSAIVLFHF